jgi:hypothetical protein
MVRFIWRAHGVGQSPDHLTSYQYYEQKSTVTTFEAARECLRLRERASIEFPLKGMVQEAIMRHGELHSGQVYISISVPVAGVGEAVSDQQAVKDLDQIAAGSDKVHFSFVLDRRDIDECVASWPLDEAVNKLAYVFLNTVA